MQARFTARTLRGLYNGQMSVGLLKFIWWMTAA